MRVQCVTILGVSTFFILLGTLVVARCATSTQAKEVAMATTGLPLDAARDLAENMGAKRGSGHWSPARS